MSLARKVVIVGGGGQASVILDILLLRPEEFQPVGLTDPDPKLRGRSILGVPVLGPDEMWDEVRRSGVSGAIVAIGANALRAHLADEVRARGFELINAVHPQAIIARDAHLGGGIAVMAGAVINTRTAVGDNAIVNTAASLDHDCVVGPAAHIAPGTHLGGGVHVGQGAMIGLGASVIPGISVGEWSIVGAGAVVVHNVAPKTTVVGNPATVLYKSARG